MLFIDNQGIHDPSINLAIEEYALKHLSMDESYLLLYQQAFHYYRKASEYDRRDQPGIRS